jgi:hypothetical protein
LQYRHQWVPAVDQAERARSQGLRLERHNSAPETPERGNPIAHVSADVEGEVAWPEKAAV